MNAILELSAPLLGVWLAITGAAIVSGAVCAVVISLRQKKFRRRDGHEGLQRR